MSGDVHGDRPSPEMIRRVLQECMSFVDLDAAMGWPRGTARRRRWRPLERGGLPPPDAELGDEPIWFRETFTAWASSPRSPAAGRPPATPEAEAGRMHDRAQADARPRSGPSATEGDPRLPQPEEGGSPARPPALQVDALGTRLDAPPEGTRAAGLVLAVREQELVVAWIRGAWRTAEVVSRDRRTVVLQYRVAAGPLGVLHQRVGLAHVRLFVRDGGL